MLGSPTKFGYLTEAEHQRHKKSLKHMKPVLKFTEPPTSFPHLRKKVIDPFRESQINHENSKIKNRINELMKSKSTSGLGGFRHSSLNKDFRVKELQRIERENEGLKKRLQGADSSYQLKLFLHQRKDNERYIKTRCIYGDAPLLKKSEPELIHSEVKLIGDIAYSFKLLRWST
jgi:hypothetical protein